LTISGGGNSRIHTPTTNSASYYEFVCSSNNGLFNWAAAERSRPVPAIKVLLFTSSSTVYGEDSRIHTREDYAPREPISVYGSPELSCEVLRAGYAHTYGLKAIIRRLANIIGHRSTHGVVYHLVRKLTRTRRSSRYWGWNSNEIVPVR